MGAPVLAITGAGCSTDMACAVSQLPHQRRVLYQTRSPLTPQKASSESWPVARLSFMPMALTPLPASLPASGQVPPAGGYVSDLTTREVEVLQHAAQGLTYAQIAGRLIISVRTVDAHLRSVYRKLGVTSRMEATRVARDHQLLGDDHR